MRLVVLTVLGLISATTHAANWVEVGITQEGEKLFVDTDSIVNHGRYRQAFIKYDQNEVQTTGSIKYDTMTNLNEYDCTRPMKTRVLSVSMTLNGKSTHQANVPNAWRLWDVIFPDSGNELVANLVCSY